MATLTVTAKGQVTLRKDLLAHLGIGPGQQVVVEMCPNGRVEIKAAKPSGKISDVFGLLKRDGRPPVSIEDMNRAAAEGWAGER